MKGNVIGFDPDINTGAISGHDGNRYDFVTQDWRGPALPRRGDLADFQAVDGRATEIYRIEPPFVAPTIGQFYFSLQGRVSRSQYWLRFVVPYVVFVFILQAIAGISGEDSAASTVIASILTLFPLIAAWPTVALQVKRIHDRDKPGWFFLCLFVPSIVFAVLLFAWLGGAAMVVVQGEAIDAVPMLGVTGVLAIVSGIIVLAVNIWFFVEFGCLRGTIGANRFGPDPVR